MVGHDDLVRKHPAHQEQTAERRCNDRHEDGPAIYISRHRFAPITLLLTAGADHPRHMVSK